MIIIAGQLKTDPSLVEDLAGALRANIPATLQEDGCLSYHFALDSREDGTVLVYERWRDQAALDAHLAQPGIAAFLGQWADKVELGVRIFDADNERGFG